MKRKVLKVISIIAVMFLSVACLLLAVSCGHEHQVNKWKTIKEPTCTTEGVQRGVCVECGEVIEQAIPTVKENHIYGEWEITVAPTNSREGVGIATKTCKENPEHKIVATLPRLSSNGAGYDYYETLKEPTVLEEGKISAMYVHEAGNISFTVSIAKKEFDPENCTVEDAVLIGSSNKDQIRSGYGLISSGYGDSFENPGGFEYEYGEDYVHTVDGDDRREFWVSRTSSGDLFGVLCIVDVDGTSEITKYAKTREAHLDGYEYNIAKAGFTYFGAEGLLKNVYDLASRNNNRDFEQGFKTNEDGEKVYYFKFGYYNPKKYLCKMSCEFTLTDTYAIRYLKLSTDTFVSLDDGQDQFYRVTDSNNNTICYLQNGVHLSDAYYREYIIYNQTTKEESPDEPIHQYTEDAFKVGSFDLLYQNKLYTEESRANFTAAGNPINFVLTNVVSASGESKKEINLFDYDPVSLYRITDTGRRIALSMSPDVDAVWYSSDIIVTRYTVKIYSKMAGTLRLMLRTESGYEKEFYVICKPANPSVLYPMAYEYNDSGYIWVNSSNNKLSTTVYAGQAITLKATVADSVKAYTDASFVAELGEEYSTATISEIDNDCISFVASKAGVYTVKLKSAVKNSVSATITITVEEPPSIDTLLTGEYTAKLKKFDANVVFKNNGDTVLAHVTTNKGEEILSLSYDSEYNILLSEHYDGANLGVRILINEAYRLVIANPTGFGSGMEEAILYVVEDEEVSGDNTEN